MTGSGLAALRGEAPGRIAGAANGPGPVTVSHGLTGKCIRCETPSTAVLCAPCRDAGRARRDAVGLATMRRRAAGVPDWWRTAAYR